MATKSSSVKTKTSVGNETVSQTVARAKAMLGSAYNPNTKASSSAVEKISNQSFINKDVKASYDRSKPKSNVQTITSQDLQPIPKVELPTKPPVNDLTSLTDSINSSLATGSNGAYTLEQGKGFVNTPQAIDKFQQIVTQTLGAKQDAFDNVNGINESLVRDQRNEIKPYEQRVSSYQNQINQIIAQRDAQQLALEGQGRGQTSGFLGGEQARIGREAAIAALPVQAQLAAAQSDLESARLYVAQLYTAKAADAQARYQYETNKIDAIAGFLNAQESRVAEAKRAEQNRAYQVEDRNLLLASDLAQTAMEFGQSTLAGRIMALDEKSPTFKADIAVLQSQVRKPVARTSDWEMKDVNGVSMWVNKFTQETKPAGDTSAGGELDKIALLRDSIERIKGREANEKLGKEAYNPLYKKASQTPFSEFFGRTFTGSSDLDNLKVYAETLSSNMLTLATDPEIKKFFGPQMSNYDVQAMKATATRLQPDNMTPKQLLSEVNRLETFVGKYEAAVKAKTGGYTQNSNIVIGADGYEYEIVE